MKLTKSLVENSPFPESGQKFLWDSDLPGFGLRISPTIKTYIAQARIKGVTRRVSLGRHGVLTIQQARAMAQQELFKMLSGVDPSVEKKKAVVSAVTLREITEKYLKDRRDLKALSQRDISKHVNHAFSPWADRPAVEITQEKVLTRFRELTDKGPAQANQAFRILRALLNYARAAYRPGGRPLFIENPVEVLSSSKIWNKVQPKSRRIPPEKVGECWSLLQALRNAPEQTQTSRCLADITCFLILSGARWNEAAELKWKDVNLAEKSWSLHDPKNRNPVTFPLSDIAVKILTDRPQKSEFVFPGRMSGHITAIGGTLKKISEISGNKISAHDLRRSFRTIAEKCGIELWKTKLLMNHKLSGDVTIQHYTETEDLKYLNKEINLIADWVEMQAAIAQKSNVIPFRGRVKEAK